ncbi:hypothetical protein AB1Y20_007565 [Prymnesium parvum]|uniref:Uncharacterized protein n=1 Tax=Prymnesium parvum TaxID=97485 RepID=A0AB34IVD2_PRYPA
MDFAIPDSAGVGPADPALLRSRGADPLIEIPTAHFFRAVSGIPLQPIPGALSPVSNAIPYSVVESVLGAIIAVDKTAASGAHDCCPLLNTLIAPAKFEAALAQAFLEPPNVKLDPNARYTSLSAAAAAIREFTTRLDPAALHPAYVQFGSFTFRHLSSSRSTDT